MTSPNGPLRIGIGGPVGAGKTTLTAALCLALRDRLSIAVVTNDIYTREDAEELMRRQVLPLDRIKGVETGGCPHTAIREDASINLAAIAELTQTFPDLDEKLFERAGELSGGQQQRLCIARTIAVSPEVILMDEPCSALDPIATAKIEELIDELRENYTIAIVTHSMQQAARVSQRTAYFHLGQLIEVNATDKVFTTPEHQLTEAYITGRFG